MNSFLRAKEHYFDECKDDIVETFKNVIKTANSKASDEMEKLTLVDVTTSERGGGNHCPSIRICVSYIKTNGDFMSMLYKAMEANKNEIVVTMQNGMMAFDIKSEFIERKINEYTEDDERQIKMHDSRNRQPPPGGHKRFYIILAVVVFIIAGSVYDDGVENPPSHSAHNRNGTPPDPIVARIAKTIIHGLLRVMKPIVKMLFDFFGATLRFLAESIRSCVINSFLFITNNDEMRTPHTEPEDSRGEQSSEGGYTTEQYIHNHAGRHQESETPKVRVGTTKPKTAAKGRS
jgi:hypothetical protein